MAVTVALTSWAAAVAERGFTPSTPAVRAPRFADTAPTADRYNMVAVELKADD